MRVQELATRIKEAGWPGDPVRFAATLVDEITDPRHGVATSEQLAAEAAAINARLTHGIGSLNERLGHEIGSLNERLGHEIGSLNEHLGHEIGSLNERLGHETASINARLTQEVALLREEMRGIETRLELRIEKALRQWGLLIIAVTAAFGTLLALLD